MYIPVFHPTPTSLTTIAINKTKGDLQLEQNSKLRHFYAASLLRSPRVEGTAQRGAGCHGKIATSEPGPAQKGPSAILLSSVLTSTVLCYEQSIKKYVTNVLVDIQDEGAFRYNLIRVEGHFFRRKEISINVAGSLLIHKRNIFILVLDIKHFCLNVAFKV